MNFIQLDSKVLKGWASNDPRYENASLIKQCGGNITDPIPCGKLLYTVKAIIKFHILMRIFNIIYRRRVFIRRHRNGRLGCWVDSFRYFTVYPLRMLSFTSENPQLYDAR